MLRSLLLGFVLLALSMLSVRAGASQPVAEAAGNASASASVEPRAVSYAFCHSFYTHSRDAWEAKQWSALLHLIEQGEPCHIYEDRLDLFSVAHLTMRKVEAYYHLEEHGRVFGLVSDLVRQDVRSDPSYLKSYYVPTLMYGSLSAVFVGEMAAAHDFVAEARLYMDAVSKTDQSLIYQDLMYRASQRGNFHFAMTLAREADPLIASPEVDPVTKAKQQAMEGRIRLIAAAAPEEDGQLYDDLAHTRLLLQKARGRLSENGAVTLAHIDGLLAFVDARQGNPASVERAEDALRRMKALREAEASDVVVLLNIAASAARLMGDHDRALGYLDESERANPATHRRDLLATVYEQRAWIYIHKHRYDRAFINLFRLWKMSGVENRYTIDSISTATIGMKGFAPWGIGAGLLLLGLGFIVVAGGRRLAQAIPDDLLPTRYVRPAVAEMHLASFGFPLFGRRSLPRDEQGSALSPPASRRLRSAIVERPSFSPLLDDPVSRVLAADPHAARALHLLNRTTGDAELLFHNLRDTDVAAPPRGVTMSLRLDDSVDPSGLRDDGHAIYTCDVSGRSFVVADGARIPVVHFDVAGEPAGAPRARLVLHPEIVTAGPEAVLRAVAVAGALRILDGLDGLRDGTVIDRCLWGTDPADLAPLPMPEWNDV